MTGLLQALRRSELASEDERAMQERIDQAAADAAADEAARAAEAGGDDAPDYRAAVAVFLNDGDGEDEDAADDHSEGQD